MSLDTSLDARPSLLSGAAVAGESVLKGAPAVYRSETGLFAGNELVEALPALPSRVEALAILAHGMPKLTNSFRQAPFEHRTQHLALMSRMFIAMPHHARAAVKILQTVRAAYEWRSFRNPTVWKHIYALSNFRYSPALLPRTTPGGGGALGILLTGLTGAGKTSFLDRLTEYLPQEPIIHCSVNGRASRQPQIPFIRIQCPHKASVKGLALDVIEQIGASTGRDYRASATRMDEPTLLGLMRALCSTFFVGLLIVDDVQFLRGLKTNAEPVLNAFCSFMELTGIPILLCGTLRMHGLLGIYPAAGSKLAASGNNLLFSALALESSDWENLVQALWSCSVLRQPLELPAGFGKLLHRHTQGVPRITREAMQALHWRLAEIEEDGDLSRFLESSGAFEALLNEVAENEIIHYQRALHVLRRSAAGRLSESLAHQYEDHVLPLDDWKALKENREEEVALPASAAGAGGKQARAKPAVASSGTKVTPTCAVYDDSDKLVQSIVTAKDPYSVAKDLGWIGAPLRDIA